MPTIYQRLEKVIQAANKAIIAELPLGRQFSEFINPGEFISDAKRILGKARLADALYILENTHVTPALFKRIISSEYIFQDTGLILFKNEGEFVEKMASVARTLGNDATKQDGFFRLCRRLKIRNADSVKGFAYELHYAESQIQELDSLSELVHIRGDNNTDADVKLLGNIFAQCKNYSTPITKTKSIENWFKAVRTQTNHVKFVVPDKNLISQNLRDYFQQLRDDYGMTIEEVKHP